MKLTYNQDTTETFIAKARAIHGDRYDYSLVNYINSVTKVKIICSEHGVFEKTPKNHTSDKTGCRACAYEALGKRKSLTTKEFINKAKNVHEGKYDYSKSEYPKNGRIKLTVTCKIHGDFKITSHDHLTRKVGCRKCGSDTGGLKRVKTLNNKRCDLSNISLPPNTKAIPLTKGYYTIVDEEDYERLCKFNWSYSGSKPNNGYAIKGFSKRLGLKAMIMHRFIMNLSTEDERVVDHINHDKLDNRKENLRICTQAENTRNSRKVIKPTTSKYKGVVKGKNGLWTSAIKYEDKYYHLGSKFITEEDAAIAYDQKAKELHKEFACLNFPEEHKN